MTNYDFKFYVNGREFKTLCKTVKNAEAFGVKFTLGGHTITAEISDKCVFKTIDGIELKGVKTDYYICKEYLTMEGFIYKLNDSFSTFINTVLSGAVGTVDELLCKILEKDEMIKPETKETATETEPEITTEIESAEETAKKTEIGINMLKYGIAKTNFLPTEIFDSKDKYDEWFNQHNFACPMNRVFITKRTFLKRTMGSIKTEIRGYTAEILLSGIDLETGLNHFINELMKNGFEFHMTDFLGGEFVAESYVKSTPGKRFFIEKIKHGMYISYTNYSEAIGVILW